MQFQVTFKNQIATVPRFVTILLFLHSVAASPTIYSFGRTCSLQPHQMNEDSVFYVSLYNASEPNQIWCSHIAFSGHGSNSKDKYQICATPKMFLDPSCNLKLTLRNALNGTIFKVINSNISDDFHVMMIMVMMKKVMIKKITGINQNN